MTLIEPLTVHPRSTTIKRTALTLLLGVGIGIAATVSAFQYVAPAMAANESAIFNGCRPPDVPGAMTVWAMNENRLIDCWRFR